MVARLSTMKKASCRMRLRSVPPARPRPVACGSAADPNPPLTLVDEDDRVDGRQAEHDEEGELQDAAEVGAAGEALPGRLRQRGRSESAVDPRRRRRSRRWSPG